MITNEYVLMELNRQRRAQAADAINAMKAGRHSRRTSARPWRRHSKPSPVPSGAAAVHGRPAPAIP